jgi:outer membrane protein assembly factor BamE
LRFTALLTLFCAVTLLGSGCVYRVNIVQGNMLEPKDVDQLTTGMTRSQVRYLLGTPQAADPFDQDRWDYLFYYKSGKTRKVQRALLVVYFADDKVERIDKAQAPAGSGVMPGMGSATPKTLKPEDIVKAGDTPTT